MGGAALVLLVIVSAVMGRDLLAKQSEWDRIASPYSFNMARWEFENFFDKWEYKLREVCDRSELSEAEKVELVQDYVSLAEEIASLEARIDREKAEGLGSEKDIGVWEAQLAALKTERDGLEGRVEEIIESHLYTNGVPDPDLIIRTSGEERLSGFLLWQSAYSELYFAQIYWPAVRRIDIWRALRSYQQRSRRFGQ